MKPEENSTGGGGLREFHILVSVFAAFCVALIWAADFVPLQDYPMRLFVGFAAATFDSPAYNWSEFFELRNSYGSFTFTFWFLRIFEPWFGIEAAGRIFLSFYILLTAVFVFVESRNRQNVPWGLLLLFPLAFNQTYMLGLMGYFISVPILMLGLRHFNSVLEKPLTPRAAASHLPFQAVIFLCHPLTSAVYAGFTGVICLFKSGWAFLRGIFLAGGFFLFFVTWYFLSAGSGGVDIAPRWWPLESTVQFFLLMFSGMKLTNGPDWAAVGLWCAVGIFLAYAAWRMRGKTRFSTLDLTLLAIAALGFFAFPFSPAAPFTYFNIRLVAIVYFLIAVVLSNIPMCRFAGRIFAVLVAAVLLWQAGLQLKLSGEIAEIQPVLERMEKNSTILPVVENGKSAHIDPSYFYQFHEHVPEYYHSVVGGGASPYLMNPAFPIWYRSRLDMREVLGRPNWKDYACCYKYVLARGDRFEKQDSLGPFRMVARSGKWSLYEAEGKQF
ncbi:MAG: hypothetical protein ACR2NQ_02910 [Thermodesulfobacteriota bacterium]